MPETKATQLIMLAVCWMNVSACGSVGRTGLDHTQPLLGASQVTTRSVAKIITAADLASVQARSTVDAIRLLRPEFLRRATPPRPNVDGDLPTVYVDDVYGGGLEVLSTVPLRAIREIYFLKPGEAGIRYGFKHVGAVILVRTWAGH